MVIHPRRFLVLIPFAISAAIGGLVGSGPAFADPDPPPPPAPGIDAPNPPPGECWISRRAWVPCDAVEPDPAIPDPGIPGAFGVLPG